MTLWTPDGERPINSKPSEPSPTPGSPGSPTPGSPGAEAPELTPEQEEQAREMAKELAETRVRLMETEVSAVLANHAMGIYELAAIHLTADQPKIGEAKLAVDALATLVEGLEGRLGEGEQTLKEALHQARMVFVQRKSQLENSEEDSNTPSE